MELTDLSPTAQRLVNAYEGGPLPADMYTSLAAVLLSVANDVAPENYESFNGNSDYDEGQEARNGAIRDAILALVDELNEY